MQSDLRSLGSASHLTLCRRHFITSFRRRRETSNVSRQECSWKLGARPVAYAQVGRLVRPKWDAFRFDRDRDPISHSRHKRIGWTIIVANDVVMNQGRCGVPNSVRPKHADLPIAKREIITAEVASVEATMQDDWPRNESRKNITERIGSSASFKRLGTGQPTDVLYCVGVRNVRICVRRQVGEVSQY
jgi:hypothetical protein